MESFLYGGIAIDYYNIVELFHKENVNIHENNNKKVISASFKNRNCKMAQNNKK